MERFPRFRVNSVSDEARQSIVIKLDLALKLYSKLLESRGGFRTGRFDYFLSRTSDWSNPEEDSSLSSVFEMPKIPSSEATAAKELPKPMTRLKNYAF